MASRQKKVIRLLNIFLNYYNDFKFICSSRNDRLTVKKNEKFSNCHKGERCFIVANGPSLNNVDLSLLTNEYVFTLNEIMRLDSYPLLKSNYHFIMDPAYFSGDDFLNERIGCIKKINTYDNKPKCFFPIEAKKNIEKNPLYSDLDINYICCKKNAYDDMKLKIDMSKNALGFSSVVLYAVEMALYMGFEKIYILGCDMTAHIHYENKAQGVKLNQIHAYKQSDSEMEKEYNYSKNEGIDMADVYESVARIFLDFRNLYRYACFNGVEMYNLTGGLLDFIPNMNIEEVIK